MRHPYFESKSNRSGRQPAASAFLALVITAVLMISGTARAQDSPTQDYDGQNHSGANPAQSQAQQDQTPPPPPPDAKTDAKAGTPQQPSTPDSGSTNPNNVRAVRLSDVEGKVQVFNGNQQAFDQAQLNMPAMEGMRLVTGSDGRVEIQFEDGSVVRVTPNSSITLAQLHRESDGSTVTTIDANTGLTYYELNGRAGQYSVRVGAGTITPVDSSIFRVSLDQNPELAVTHGTVHYSDGQNAPLEVLTNQSVQFDPDNPAQYEVAQSVTADSWDQWNSDRDQALATLDENATTARAGTGNPDDPAWADLDYYGDWYNVPGYGEAWAPSGVGAGWDPFANGGWGYYSGVGYSWISSNPWGWWPYHCGAWNYFNSYGWMWFPGNCGWGSIGAGWYPYASVWRTPQGYRPPVRPPSPSHGLPPHGSSPHPEPFIAVNRTSDTPFQFRSIGQAKPAARDFEYQGAQIRPQQSTVRVHDPGPLGESFTSSVVRSNPEIYNSIGRGRAQGSGPGSSDVRGSYLPGNRGYTPPTTNNSRPGWSPAPRPSESPHFSAPPAPPAPASHPSSGGHPR